METKEGKEKREKEQQAVKNEDNRQLQLLEELEKIEAFQLWRSLVVDSTLQQLEAEINSQEADKMPEVILRSKLKHLNSLKYLFHNVFEQAKIQRKLNQ